VPGFVFSGLWDLTAKHVFLIANNMAAGCGLGSLPPLGQADREAKPKPNQTRCKPDPNPIRTHPKPIL
jgi:hypothetical protein